MDNDEKQNVRGEISQRLSLRAPQKESLDILADVIERIGFEKGLASAPALEAIKEIYPSVEDFEREFPSVCFALATGVGKTRLMGAFAAYLFMTERAKNFFVLAPNTTIYNKLIQDFSVQSSPKYVFKGIAEFAQRPPIIVTGDTWEQGRGVRGRDLHAESAIINIFNVDKINKDGGRIKRMHEYIGQSYFDYLAGLPDLVLMMDEAHRYRATAGMDAITELRPVVGLEFTATPKTAGAQSQPFKNVIFNYKLSNAMADGFVKEPAAATRANFKKTNYDQDRLEEIMLTDGVHHHQYVKTNLEIYAQNTGQSLVHPFVLVVAQDTAHADKIKVIIESDEFFEGQYKDRVAVVHSNQKGAESDDAMQRLVGLETDNETEIVIHVNKLKEGWDVTNLYTIVPLRASASEILTEQTLGRGLRLPYGARTGVEAVDTLTVIAHDKFDEVIAKAREEGSIIRMKKIVIDERGGVGEGGAYRLAAPTIAESELSGRKSGVPGLIEMETPQTLATEDERVVASEVLKVIQNKFEKRLIQEGVQGLSKKTVQEEIIQDVIKALPKHASAKDKVEKVVQTVAKKVTDQAIEIPEIFLIPAQEVTFGYKNFDLANLEEIRHQPISDQMLIRNLRNESQIALSHSFDGARQMQVEDYIMRHLMEVPAIDYSDNADLLYKLVRQVIDHLQSYLALDGGVENVVLNHGKELAEFILRQMKDHYWETPTEYGVKVTRVILVLKPQNFNISGADRVRDVKNAAAPKSDTKKFVFTGFKKCLYQAQKFDSDSERRFAEMIDRDFEKSVVRWVKLGPHQFQIRYSSREAYEPDFIVERDKEKLIVEVKARDEMEDETVKAKARAAVEWVQHANEYVKANGGKPWRYLLIPDDQITESMKL